jgi:hypothetical protein
MSPEEAEMLLKFVKAGFPETWLDGDASMIWHALGLDDVEIGDAVQALKRLTQAGVTKVNPGLIIKEVKAIRRDRIEHAGLTAAPEVPQIGGTGTYRAELKRQIEAMADGLASGRNLRAIAAGRGEHRAPDLTGLRAALGEAKVQDPVRPVVQPPVHARYSPETMARYEKARRTLAARNDLGEAPMAKARLELGKDAPGVEVALRAAELSPACPGASAAEAS